MYIYILPTLPGQIVGQRIHTMQPDDTLDAVADKVVTSDGSNSTDRTDLSAEYHTVHKRLANLFGSASDAKCWDCGGQAREWSCNRTSPYARRIKRHVNKSGGRVIEVVSWVSPRLGDYQARCRACHIAYDATEVTA